jgi:hypothetical protein
VVTVQLPTPLLAYRSRGHDIAKKLKASLLFLRRGKDFMASFSVGQGKL